MSSTSPFSGIKLSGEAAKAPPQVDQRLFTPDRRAGPAPSEAASPPGDEREVGKEGKRAERPPATATAPQPAGISTDFDINEKPWRKDSFLFTDGEFERLDDIKLELRRRFDLKATKNDIARAAFQQLFEDYRRDPAASSIVRALRKKTP